ncbi:MAG: acylphosphatase [Lachnospiraceae bacterium]|nr:acylphosphatase [Lachnospiraceae bacterium]MCD8249817.1 acylphosphatase [Lachnospiraceae bacterium]
MIVRKHIRFYGRVQGVGFRYYSTYKAQFLGLTGWVRNCDDGSVEMEVQGEPELISDLIRYLGRQHFIRIDRMDEEEEDLQTEGSFREVWW